MSTNERVVKLDNWSDRLSPMVVKEVRQMVRGKEFNYSFGLALIAGLVVAFFGLASAVDMTGGVGADIFTGLIVCLIFEALIIVPLGAFNALRTEKSDNTLDLITQTALTPLRIVVGKLMTQGVKIVIIFAGLAPFVAMSFLLGGVNLQTIGIALLVLFVWALWVCAACLFVSAASASRAVSAVLFIVMTVGFFIMAGRFNRVWMPLLGIGPYAGSGPAGSALWWVLGASTLFCFISMGNLILLAENRLALPVEDRSTSLRIGFFIQFLFIVVCCLGPLWGGMTGYARPDAITALGTFGGLQLALVSIFSTTEEMSLSRRVLRNIKSSLRRPWFAIFRPGGGRASAWVLVQMALLIGIGAFLSKGGGSDFQWLLGACSYILFFSGVPACLGRMIFKSRINATRLRVATFIFFPIVMLSADILQYFLKWPLLNIAGTFSPFHVLNPIRALANWTDIASIGFDWWVFIMGIIGFYSYYVLIRIGQQETKNGSILHPAR
jgi:hypothetical protein